MACSITRARFKGQILLFTCHQLICGIPYLRMSHLPSLSACLNIMNGKWFLRSSCVSPKVGVALLTLLHMIWRGRGVGRRYTSTSAPSWHSSAVLYASWSWSWLEELNIISSYIYWNWGFFLWSRVFRPVFCCFVWGWCLLVRERKGWVG